MPGFQGENQTHVITGAEGHLQPNAGFSALQLPDQLAGHAQARGQVRLGQARLLAVNGDGMSQYLGCHLRPVG